MNRVNHLNVIHYFLNPEFTVAHDVAGNEYVFLKQLAPDYQLEKYTTEDEDKTALEASVNHIHFFDEVTKEEIPYLSATAQAIGTYMIQQLQDKFPEKRFVFYTEIALGEPFTMRFHQKWKGEQDYFDTENISQEFPTKIMYKFELEKDDVIIYSSLKEKPKWSRPHNHRQK